MCFESIRFSPLHCLCCVSSDKLSHLQSINMESLNALCVLFSMVYGPPLFPPPSFPHAHTRASFGSCVRCESRFEPSTGFFMTTVGEICWSHLQWASVTPFVTLGKSAKSKCGVSPVCVFNVPLLLSPMTRGGPPRVLALSPGVLSLLYLSTRHGRSPKDNHTCMLKKGLFFFSFISTPTEKIRRPKLFPYSSCFIHGHIWDLFFPPTTIHIYIKPGDFFF